MSAALSGVIPGLFVGAAERPALVVPGGVTLTYAALEREVARTAAALRGLGIGPEDRVAFALPNSAEAVVAFAAATWAGVAAPLNPAYREDEFRFYLEDTRARALLVPPGAGEAARRALPEGSKVIEMAIDQEGTARFSPEPPGGSVPAPPDPEHVALVLHTSGTTSRPKIVPLSHRHVAASTANVIATYALGPEDLTVALMPLFHIHGLVASTLATLATGGTLVVPAGFNPLGFWPLAAEVRPTWWTASPAPLKMILGRATGGRPAGLDRLRFLRSCSSALAPVLMEQLEASLQAPVLEAYGMSEAAHQMASNPLPPAVRVPGSVGKGTGVEIAILDAAAGVAPAGSQGEVAIRGPNVFSGYEANPEANATAFAGDWFRTGDRGYLDGDGYLTLVGRIKELINRGGEKIAPPEIDAVLETHPQVLEAVSFGIPHPTWGEEVAVAVVLEQPVSERELQAWMRERLADFKIPRTIHVVESIPRTPTGKIQRRHVAEAVIRGR
ncbi:MAG: AMP-binding protein [Candidatus Dormibacteraeota bacterium]|nr:AMP-binding protein [Candidatus Dormibacteraeota bacterium]